MHAKKPKLRHRQINHVGLNTSFSEIFALYIVSKRALVLKNFWTTNIRGIHIVTLLVVKCGDEITPKFLKPGKILQRLEDAPFVKNCQPTPTDYSTPKHGDSGQYQPPRSGLVYARDGVLLAGCESLPELATAP